MTDADLFEATIPVFRHYLARMDRILARLPDDTVLTGRLVPDTFTAGEHFASAQGFTLRAAFPLAGKPIPELSTDDAHAEALRQRSVEATRLLASLEPGDFAGAAQRIISHQAGTAKLSQNATEFATLYALPNMIFHLTMAYATLRRAGTPIGKADFDGFHTYPTTEVWP